MISLALVYCSQRALDWTSMGLSFHRLSGSWMRMRNRNCCSSSLIENQYFSRMVPERTSMRSNSGTEWKNSWYCSSVQNPITRSTPARLYQLRSNRTIFSAGGKMRHAALKVPLGAFALARSGQRRDPADPRIEALRDPFDDPALSCRVAALEDDHDLELLLHDPVLHLHQLALQAKQLLEVDATIERRRLRMLGQLGEQLGQAIVVDLHLEFFVDGIEHLAIDAMEPRIRVVGHGWDPGFCIGFDLLHSMPMTIV